jgi:hypothetical protein
MDGIRSALPSRVGARWGLSCRAAGRFDFSDGGRVMAGHRAARGLRGQQQTRLLGRSMSDPAMRKLERRKENRICTKKRHSSLSYWLRYLVPELCTNKARDRRVHLTPNQYNYRRTAAIQQGKARSAPSSI